MKISTAKPLAVLIAIASVLSFGETYAHSSSSSSSSSSHDHHCRRVISEQKEDQYVRIALASLNQLVSDLDRVFIAESLVANPGADVDILNLIAATNGVSPGSLGQAIIDFGNLFLTLGVDPALATNAVDALNNYVLAAEAYSLSVASGDPAPTQATFLAAFFNAGTDLANALDALSPNFSQHKIANYISDLVNYQAEAIINYSIPNYIDAIANDQGAHEAASNLALYLVEERVCYVNHQACHNH